MLRHVQELALVGSDLFLGSTTVADIVSNQTQQLPMIIVKLRHGHLCVLLAAVAAAQA